MRRNPTWAIQGVQTRAKGASSIACLLFVAVMAVAFWAGALWAGQSFQSWLF